MRRVLASLVAAGVLLVGAVGPVAATDPVTVTITSASLVARGVAVEVDLDVVCQPLEGETALLLEYGFVRVDQAVSKKAVAGGMVDLYGGTFVCDGSTVNSLEALVRTNSVPFRKGVAMVEAYIYLVDSWYNFSESGRSIVTLKLQ
jgi:hypothetical protein